MSDAPSPPSGLSARAYNTLRQLTIGQKMDEVPQQLVDRKLVRSERWTRQPDLIRMVWVVTPAGRSLVATHEHNQAQKDDKDDHS